MSKEIYSRLINTVCGKRVAVLGLGVSNTPLVSLLCDIGRCKSICIYDKKSVEELGESAKELSAIGVEFVQGFEHIDADVIFRSPGIRPDIDGIKNAMEAGAVLTSEMEMFLSLTPAATFGITGSDGKTTTTTLTGLFLSKAYEEKGGGVFVGGNIGTPLLDKCADMSENDFAVLELSSFQLMRVGRAPAVCAITNLSPNHMDWHTDEGEYAAAKHNIVGDDTRRVVLNADCDHTYEFGKELCRRGEKEIIFFSSRINRVPEKFIPALSDKTKLIYIDEWRICISDGKSKEVLLDISDIRLPGWHNIENYMTAIALTYGFVKSEVYREVALNFFGVEHRLQRVRTLNGVEYYNSSIDSSPTRTAAALSALDGRDIVIICGGYDKNLSYEPLALSLCKKARVVVLTGANAPKIKAAILDCKYYDQNDPSALQIIDAPSFEDAVAMAHDAAREGGCVLLSPASASFDRFKNFAERGKYFTELVNRL